MLAIQVAKELRALYPPGLYLLLVRVLKAILAAGGMDRQYHLNERGANMLQTDFLDFLTTEVRKRAMAAQEPSNQGAQSRLKVLVPLPGWAQMGGGPWWGVCVGCVWSGHAHADMRTGPCFFFWQAPLTLGCWGRVRAVLAILRRPGGRAAVQGQPGLLHVVRARFFKVRAARQQSFRASRLRR